MPTALNFIVMNDIKIFITAERGREEWDCENLTNSTEHRKRAGGGSGGDIKQKIQDSRNKSKSINNYK